MIALALMAGVVLSAAASVGLWKLSRRTPRRGEVAIAIAILVCLALVAMLDARILHALLQGHQK